MSDAQVRRLLAPVVKSLRAGNNAEATRRFVAAMSHDLGIQQADLPQWLESVIGKELARQMIRALAALPCMGCKRGLEPCRECNGKGLFGDDRICDLCVGLGATNCGFCAGSGWMTYNYAPAGIRVAVVLERTRLVLSAAEALLQKPIPTPGPDDLAAGRKVLAGLIVQLNRYLGALNNAAGVALHPATNDSDTNTRLEKVRKVCARAGERLEDRLRKVLAALAGLHEIEAARASTVARVDLADRRARFYDRLAASADFAGTNLYHVYLRQLGEGGGGMKKHSRPPPRPRSAPRSASR